ncbi:MAG TPA: tRNA preQ1(34) S-adenosylmethionine ribosyltransferase-isomerase QueA [Candidatus Udaeobacter sp.]|nr:tRNA preQ1(34) S-adenosylmethionine ribosyltransferase-isomerase QueA [Candidatus Udaeobacter sp.]
MRARIIPSFRFAESSGGPPAEARDRPGFGHLDYDLPPDRIAQHPATRREQARLLVVERDSGALHDQRFESLRDWLRSGDVLVVNETRVRPARLAMRRAPGGGAVELLFVRPEPGDRWRVLARPAKKARPGATLETPDGAFAVEVTDAAEQGERVVRIIHGSLDSVLRDRGEIPLPPYIHRAPAPEDRERYQTVYARTEGAVAAPTAGLHFTNELLSELAARGITAAPVVLHVGPGTFRPISADDPARHHMDEEWFDVPASTAGVLERCRASGGRIVAVGTTSVRALESACDVHGGRIGAASGWTKKFILPPYRFQSVDALITNFHLPRTTLLLLVSAFAGEELLKRAYDHAIAGGYRFYSYGDAMLIL